MRYAARDRLGSTDSAVGDTTENVLYLACSEFGVDRLDRSEPAERAVRALQPVYRPLSSAKEIMSNGDDTREPVKPVRFILR